MKLNRLHKLLFLLALLVLPLVLQSFGNAWVRIADMALLYVMLAVASSALIGLLAGVLPARRAAHLDPVDALRAE